MCNSLKSTLVTWLVMMTLFLSGCAAYQPGVAVASGAPLCVGECMEVISHVVQGGNDSILLTRNGSYVFGQLTRDGWRMVLAQPKGAGELLSAQKSLNYESFLRALKESGWVRVAPAATAGIIKQFFGVMGNFIFIIFTGLENLPGVQTVGLG